VNWSTRRAALSIVLIVLGTACAGDATSTTADSGSSAAPISSGPSSPSPSPSPLVVPKGCKPDGPAVEISTVNASWADADGHPFAPGEACLAVPAGHFTVTVHNDVLGVGIGSPNHNFAVFTDSLATESVFTGDLVYSGQSKTYDVPKLSPGTYLFHCDIHPQTMYGVLSVK
jgi:plastocyanin